MGFRIGILTEFAQSLLEYETQKVVQIHSKKVGLIFRLIQLGIVLYVVVWVMIYEKGYQTFDNAVSGVTAKLKGIAFANVTDNQAIGATVWDAADYVIPPQQNSAFFVMTNIVSTPGQRLGRCEESHDVYNNNCVNASQCQSGRLVLIGSGVQTGRCVPSTRSANLSVCEIYGWCPTEHDITPRPHLLTSAENFTVMLKNSIEFPRWKVKRRNILTWMNKLFLKRCRYNPHNETLKYCPIFRLGDIVNYSDAKNTDVWTNGGMMSIQIVWNCNLDLDVEKCLPKYTFRRLDDFESPVAKGWNFRFSQHYIENGVRKRNLVKAHGIQFFITVYGTGRKFDPLTFSMNLGSGLALLGIATVLCDMIVLNVTRKRGIYRKAKVDLVSQKTRRASQAKRNKERGLRQNTAMEDGDDEIIAERCMKTGSKGKRGRKDGSKRLWQQTRKSDGEADHDRPHEPVWVDSVCPTRPRSDNKKSFMLPPVYGQPSIIGFKRLPNETTGAESTNPPAMKQKSLAVGGKCSPDHHCDGNHHHSSPVGVHETNLFTASITFVDT